MLLADEDLEKTLFEPNEGSYRYSPKALETDNRYLFSVKRSSLRIFWT